MAALLFVGCAAEDTFETVADEILQSVEAPMAEMILELPEEAAAPVAQGEAGSLYQCDGYEIALQTFASGDLDATLRASTGHGRDDLTVIETRLGKLKRYDLVWSCLGEQGDQIGRACVLDDGNYHYVLSVLGEADRMGEFEEVWEELFSSYALG
jgi:hypothetical protein